MTGQPVRDLTVKYRFQPEDVKNADYRLFEASIGDYRILMTVMLKESLKLLG